MKKQKQTKKKHAHQKSTSSRSSRLEFIKRDDLGLTIPIGPRFQAQLPDWSHSVANPLEANGGHLIPLILEVHNDNVSESSSRWLSTIVWPTESRTTDKSDMNMVGKGRPKFCLCMSPGSVECIKRHVASKRIQLQAELGPAFWKWKFDEMGEDVSKLWTQEEQKKFEILVKRNNPAIKSFPLKCRKSIASYYFNIYVPKKIGYKTRLGCTIETGDEEEENSNLKGSRKRLCVDDVRILTNIT